VTRPWRGEIDVTSEIARQLVRSQFPAIDASVVRLLGSRSLLPCDPGKRACVVHPTARLRAAFHAISVPWYGVETEDDNLLHERRLALDCVLED
jgi:hypothetical protein